MPERSGPHGLRVFTAVSIRARLLGLALLDEMPAGCALLIPRCSSIHTFGMRFAIDVGFLGAEGEVLRVERAVGTRRVVRCRGAAAVLEWRAECGGGGRDAS